ncbi:MAG: hypothetical protein IKR49_02720 [Clostridia bacterium]|nr:hypothetical protein [Clostridia bacterium]
MKKVLAILLCVVMLFSCAAVFAFADDAAPAETVTITFYDDDNTVLNIVVVEKGQVPVGPPAPVKARQDGDPEWEFSGWLGEDGKTYYSGTLPVANSDMSYIATYKKLYDNEAEGNITLISFISSIFARLNKLFAQISTYYEELAASVQKLLG